MIRVTFAAVSACAVLTACGLDLSLPEQPRRGEVFGALDTNQQLPPSGHEVVLVAEDGAPTVRATGETGEFRFTDVVPGTYYLKVALPGFAVLVVPNIKVRAGAQFDLGSVAPQWLGGTQSEGALSGKVVVPGGGDPFGGQVEFVLQPVNKRVAVTPLGPSGDFVQRLPPGSYTLRASHPLYVTGVASDVLLGEGEEKDLSSTPIVLDLNPATLGGEVFRERDGQSAAPAVGALVTLDTGVTTTVDAAGRFQVTGLPAGSRTVRLQLSGHHDAALPHPVQLGAGQISTLPRITLKLDRGTLRGQVTVADGQPATDISVSLTGTSYSAVVSPSASAPATGMFQISGVPVGIYEVTAIKARYARSVVGSVAVTFDGATDVGTLTLTELQGDFIIDDGDSTNTPGYTRAAQVTLMLTGFSSAAKFRASEDQTFASVAFQPFTGSAQPFTLQATEGTHTVYVQYEDANGTPSAVFSSKIILDSTAPTSGSVVVNGGAAFTSVAQPLTVTLTATELASSGVDTVSGLAAVRLSASSTVDVVGNLSGAPQPYQRDMLFVRPSTADGVQPVHVQFIDHAGNVSAVASSSIVIDTQPPAGSLTVSRGARATADGYTNSLLVTLSEQAAPEPNGGFTLIKLANSQAELQYAVLQPVQPTAGWFLSPGSDGARTVYAELRDAAGNSSGPFNATIVYDATAPSPATAALTGSSVVNSQAISLSLSAADAFALSPTEAVTASESPTFQGATASGYPSNNLLGYSISSGDGQKQIYVRFRDAAGNDAVVAVAVTLDTVAPTGTFAIEGVLADGTVSTAHTSTTAVTLVVDQTGASGYLLGTETLSSCPATGYSALSSTRLAHTLPSLQGPREVRLCLRDAAGNTTGPLSAFIRLDTVSPTDCALTLSGRKVDGTSAPSKKTATATVTAAVGACSETPAELFLTSGLVSCTAGAPIGWVPFSSSQPFLLAGPDGVNTVRGCVRDAARNVAAVALDTIELDTTPPAAPQLLIDSGAAYVNGAQVAARGGYIAQVVGSATGATEWALSTSTTFATFESLATSPKSYTFSGEGPQTLYGLFRDEVGNLSAVASDSIIFDTLAPDTSAATLVVAQPSNGYTSSPSVTLGLTAPADALSVQVANAANAAGCAESDFTGKNAQPTFQSLTHLLAPAEGLQRVCVRLIDAAGNVSSALSTTITLDSVAPDSPAVLSLNEIRAVPDGTTHLVNVAAPGADSSFSHYEFLGGKTASWTVATPTVNGDSSLTFSFTLRGDPSIETGIQNVLRLRAVDFAGNGSPEGSVVVTTDTNAPDVAVLNPRWVWNGDSRGTVYWQPSASPDVVSYRVYYGSASRQYSGLFADQGASPVTVGKAGALTLTGLANGSAVYVTVRAVDHAGNEYAGSTVEAVLQPNRVSPSLLHDVALTMTRAYQIVVHDDLAYVIGVTGCSTATGDLTLNVVDLSRIVSPVQGGRLDPAAAAPSVIASSTFPDAVDCSAASSSGISLLVDGPYAYIAAGSKVRVLSLSTPKSPVSIATIDLSTQLRSARHLAVRARRMFVGGVLVDASQSSHKDAVVAVNLDKLYDEDAATLPSSADVIGTASTTDTTFPPGALTLTRSHLVQADGYYDKSLAYSAAGALASPPGTFSSTSLLAGTPDGIRTLGSTSASGNYFYFAGFSRFIVHKLDALWSSNAIFGSAARFVDVAFSNFGPVDLRASQVILQQANGGGLRVLDLSDIQNIQNDGATFVPGVSNSLMASAGYGPYHLVVTNTARLLVFEAATPMLPRTRSAANGLGGRSSLSGRFLYAGGTVADLQSGSTPAVISPSGVSSDDAACYYDAASFDDVTVTSRGTSLRVWNLEDAVDDPLTGTTFDGADSSNLSLAAGRRATGLTRYGNFLIMVDERRNADNSIDGSYVSVYDATALRDRDPATVLNLATPVGSFKYVTDIGYAQITMHHGRAFISHDSYISGLYDGVYILDLRPLFDGDSTTGLTAAAAQGFFRSSSDSKGGRSTREVVVRGNHLYLASSAGLEVVDVSAGLDQDSATTVSTSPPRALLSHHNAVALAVHGSYAIVGAVGTDGEGFLVADISTPLSPRVMAKLPFARHSNDLICTALGLSPRRASLAVHGTRAYFSSHLNLQVLDLE